MTETAQHANTNNKIIIIVIFIIIIIIIRHSVLLLFFIRSSLALLTLSPHSVTVTYTSSSPVLFFPFVAGWWLPCCYRCVGKSKCPFASSQVWYFFDLEKSSKTGNVPGKPGRTRSLIAKLRLRQSKAKAIVV